MRSDIGLSARRCTEIRENPTRRATYNPAGGGFHRLVENRPDPDAGAGYPSIPSTHTRTHAHTQVVKASDVAVLNIRVAYVTNAEC